MIPDRNNIYLSGSLQSSEQDFLALTQKNIVSFINLPFSAQEFRKILNQGRWKLGLMDCIEERVYFLLLLKNLKL